jgi:hypothetical protein
MDEMLNIEASLEHLKHLYDKGLLTECVYISRQVELVQGIGPPANRPQGAIRDCQEQCSSFSHNEAPPLLAYSLNGWESDAYEGGGFHAVDDLCGRQTDDAERFFEEENNPNDGYNDGILSATDILKSLPHELQVGLLICLQPCN